MFQVFNHYSDTTCQIAAQLVASRAPSASPGHTGLAKPQVHLKRWAHNYHMDRWREPRLSIQSFGLRCPGPQLRLQLGLWFGRPSMTQSDRRGSRWYELGRTLTQADPSLYEVELHSAFPGPRPQKVTVALQSRHVLMLHHCKNWCCTNVCLFMVFVDASATAQ